MRPINDLTNGSPVFGYGLSLGAACGYGVGTYLALVSVRDYAPPLVASSYALFFGLIIMAGLFHRSAFSDVRLLPARGWVVVSLAGLAGAFGVVLLFWALTEAPVVVVSPITGINPLVAILLTHVFLQRFEHVTKRTIVGGILVVAGVALVAIRRS